ncbi:hypothetical protein NDU88_008922 [Pleurodeles waltl]|uniref:Uncharacterized protein n=1 Tax=Pleurodeles waltl TaxID=8319 RepID=A0AAV7NXG7_PLEWA|nr:hypothetical protein NDU88_008922 [Pleurodeles waltl]
MTYFSNPEPAGELFRHSDRSCTCLGEHHVPDKITHTSAHQAHRLEERALSDAPRGTGSNPEPLAYIAVDGFWETRATPGEDRQEKYKKAKVDGFWETRATPGEDWQEKYKKAKVDGFWETRATPGEDRQEKYKKAKVDGFWETRATPGEDRQEKYKKAKVSKLAIFWGYLSDRSRAKVSRDIEVECRDTRALY